MSVAETLEIGRIRPVAEILSDTRRAIDPVMFESIGGLPGDLGRMARYHFGWRDRSAYNPTILTAGGKAVRPALVLLCAAAIDPAGVRPVPVAVAVELVHNFSLIHDDVMDGDLERRHRATLWAKYGTSNAILVGDALLALALRILAAASPPLATAGTTELAHSVITLCEGQFHDIEFEQLESVPVADCLAMMTDKTAALMQSACALGGIAAGASETQMAELRKLGGHIGLAFQLIDDYLGIWGESGVTGKPVGKDLVRKKKSLPVAVALNAANGCAEELADLYRQPGPLAQKDLARAMDIIDGTGAQEWLRQRVRAESSAALECIRRLAGAAPATDELGELTESLAVRVR